MLEFNQNTEICAVQSTALAWAMFKHFFTQIHDTLYQTWVWAMTRLRRRAITRRHTRRTVYTEVDMDATEVSVVGFILKLLCSGSAIMRRKTRRKRKFSTMAFCEAMAATSMQRCVWMRSWSRERGAGEGIVMWTASQKQILSKISRCQGTDCICQHL